MAAPSSARLLTASLARPMASSCDAAPSAISVTASVMCCADSDTPLVA
jgi:hypothetical protein